MVVSSTYILLIKCIISSLIVSVGCSQIQKRQYLELPPGVSIPGAPYINGAKNGGRTYIKYGRPASPVSLSQSQPIDIGKESYMTFNEITAPMGPTVPQSAPRYGMGSPALARSGVATNDVRENGVEYIRPPQGSANLPQMTIENKMISQSAQAPAPTQSQTQAQAPGAPQQNGESGIPVPQQKPVYLSNSTEYIARLHEKHNQENEMMQIQSQGSTYAQLGGGQFFQSLFGGKQGFSPLSFFLGGGAGGGRGGIGGSAPFFIPVPIVVPPPPPPPPGPECYTNKSGFLCCNVTLETAMEKAYNEFKGEGFSSCNVQKMASIVADAAEKKFGTPFESIAAHKDFVAKINFAGDLNCKIEVDGKFILAYATPLPEKEVNIIDANSFFSGDAAELLESGNGTDTDKPTYIVYGPIR